MLRARRRPNTDWVEWNNLDEDQQYRGRYQISVKPQGYPASGGR
ncbi:outer membrane protein assembly factor BamC [Klebsiella pneumoniae]|nr:outer membrane protein assembly factor BamC [Klebsiella pneumoniae]